MANRVVVESDSGTRATLEGVALTVLEGCESSGHGLPELHSMEDTPGERMAVAVVCEWVPRPGGDPVMVIITHLWTGWWFTSCIPGIVSKEGWMPMEDYIEYLDL